MILVEGKRSVDNEKAHQLSQDHQEKKTGIIICGHFQFYFHFYVRQERL